MTKVKKVSNPKGPKVAPVKVAGNAEGGDNKVASKPALHLMPGQGINTEMIAKRYKAIAGKDMTDAELAAMDAKFEAEAAEKSRTSKQARL